MPDAALLGRDDEIARLAQAVDSLGRGGGASVLIRGDAGIGKTSLLAVAERKAAARGYRSLGAAGVESEANLPFAGLNQLLRPILARAELLPHSQREALLTAVGVLDRAAPAIYLVALAVMSSLSGGPSLARTKGSLRSRRFGRQSRDHCRCGGNVLEMRPA